MGKGKVEERTITGVSVTRSSRVIIFNTSTFMMKLVLPWRCPTPHQHLYLNGGESGSRTYLLPLLGLRDEVICDSNKLYLELLSCQIVTIGVIR